MISPELLRRYPFFNFLTPEQQRSIAMIADEIEVAAGETLFRSGAPATYFYLLLEGNVDLYYDVHDALKTGSERRFYVGTLNTGEPLGVSALIEPYELTTTAVTDARTRLLRIDAVALRALADGDAELGCQLQRQIARATMERLRSTRVELLAATESQGQQAASPSA